MKKVQFLTKKSMVSDRPDWAKKVTAIVFWASSIASIIAMNISAIPPDIKSQINEWVIVCNLVIKLTSHGFGEVQK